MRKDIMAATVYDGVGDVKRTLEIVKTLTRYNMGEGLTPDRMCDMFKELGPTFVKIGQLLSMHPEIVPAEYCKKLESLRTNATQLVTAQIREIVSEEYGKPWNTVFRRIMPFPLGCASIAQVHEAELFDGERVAIKVQRPDIYEKMERDVRLLKGALGIVKLKSISEVMDLGNVLDEMWEVAKQEMDFKCEAENIRRLAENIEGIKYVYCPKVYDELSTKNILVMEYIGGCELNDIEALKRDGYDLSEVCMRFINNYIKQFAEDHFFHADPHPGNVHVCDGRIVWLDLGMMGTLTDDCAELIKVCMKAIVSNDHIAFTDAVIRICEAEVDDVDACYAAMKDYLAKYRIVSMEEMSSTVDIFSDLYHIAKQFGITVPKSMTMFWRSISIMEGVVSQLMPDMNLSLIIGKHLAAQSMVGGVAGAISKKASHRKLVSGSALSYNGHPHDPDDEVEDIEDDEKEDA